MRGLIAGDQAERGGQRRVILLDRPAPEVLIIQPGRKLLKRRINHHLAGRGKRQLPFALEDRIGEFTNLLGSAFSRAHQPLFEYQGMFGFLITPIGLKPGPTSALADQVEYFGGVIRQKQLDRAKRFDNQGDFI